MNFTSLNIIKTYADYLSIHDAFSKVLLLDSSNADNYVPEEFNDLLSDFIKVNNLSKKEAVAAILDYLKNLQLLTLKLPFSPSTSFVEKVYLVLVQNIPEQFLLKFENDISCFLGAQIEFKGKIYKYSIKEALL